MLTDDISGKKWMAIVPKCAAITKVKRSTARAALEKAHNHFFEKKMTIFTGEAAENGKHKRSFAIRKTERIGKGKKLAQFHEKKNLLEGRRSSLRRPYYKLGWVVI